MSLRHHKEISIKIFKLLKRILVNIWIEFNKEVIQNLGLIMTNNFLKRNDNRLP